MSSEFNSQNNKKVLNIGINNGNISFSEKEKSQDNKHSSNYQPIVILAIVAIVGIVIFALSNLSIKGNSTQSVTFHSSTSAQSNVTLQNTDNIVNNSSQTVRQSNDKPGPVSTTTLSNEAKAQSNNIKSEGKSKRSALNIIPSTKKITTKSVVAKPIPLPTIEPCRYTNSC